MIKISSLSKEYKLPKSTVIALKNIDLTIGDGEFVAIVGPSGSGKSTLMQMIGGMDKPTTGEVIVNDKVLSKMKDSELSEYRNNEVGFIFQLFYLQNYLTVIENIQIPLFFRGVEKKKRYELALSAATNVGMADRIDHLPKELSGGQMQRVAIARAIVGNPKVILADEPTANVDRENSDKIMEQFKHIHETLNTTIIIVTHDERIAAVCDRIIRLEDGKIVSDENK